MSRQKRKTKKDRYRQERRKARKIAKLPSYMGVCSANLDPRISYIIGKKLKAEVLLEPKYLYTTATFENVQRLKYLLNLFPDMIIIAWRHEDMLSLARFYELLDAVKHEYTQYRPKIICWEVVPADSSIPAMFPKLVPTIQHKDGVQADIALRNSERILLN